MQRKQKYRGSISLHPIACALLTLALAGCRPGHPTKSIQEAAKACDMPQIRANCYWGSDVNAPDNSGSPALLLATKATNSPTQFEAVEFLLTKGAEVNRQDGNGVSALHVAAYNGDKALCDLLIAKGAKVDAQCLNGSTPLIWAVDHEQEVTARFLLDKGANLQSKGVKGASALHFAVNRQSPSITKQLIAKGADVNAKDENGATPLHWAVVGQAIPIIELLAASKADINARDANGKTPFLVAASMPGVNLHVVEALISKGADINVKDGEGLTALHVAAVSNNRDLIELLLAKGVSVDPYDKNQGGRTPLQYAIEKNAVSAAECLIVHSADTSVDFPRILGQKANVIQWATFVGSTTILTNLLGSKQEAIAGIAEKDNLLRLALLGKHLNVLSWLVDHGASLSWRCDDNSMMFNGSAAGDDPGHNLLHYAARIGADDIVDYLLSKGMNVDGDLTPEETQAGKRGGYHSPLCVAIAAGHLSTVTNLIAHGANVNWRIPGVDRFVSTWPLRITPLLIAIRKGDLACVRLLIEKGANINSQGPFAPLAYAKEAQMNEIVALLKQRGAQ